MTESRPRGWRRQSCVYQLWTLGSGLTWESCFQRAWPPRCQVPRSPWSLAGMRIGGWRSGRVGNAWQSQLGPVLHRIRHLLLSSCLSFVIPMGVHGPVCGSLSLTLPIPVGPLWPGSNGPVAGRLGAVYFGLTGPALGLYLPCEAACNLIWSDLSGTLLGPGRQLPVSARPPLTLLSPPIGTFPKWEPFWKRPWLLCL